MNYSVLILHALLGQILLGCATQSSSSSAAEDNHHHHQQQQQQHYYHEQAASNYEVLSRTIDDELDSIEARRDSCDRSGSEISHHMDRLAERLSAALDFSEDPQAIHRELADVVGLRELTGASMAAHDHSGDGDGSANADGTFCLRGLRLTSHGVTCVLDPDNPHIVHGKKLSDEGLRKLLEFAKSHKTLKPDERLFLIDMFSHAAERDKINDEQANSTTTTLSSKLKKVADVARKATQIVYDWADRLYLSTEFLEKIPILGQGLIELKKMGQRPYQIMDTARYMHQLFMEIRELPDERSHIRRVLQHQTTRKMLSDSGLEALKLIAIKLVTRSVGINQATDTTAALKEIASRCAYFLFAQLAPRSAHCLF